MTWCQRWYEKRDSYRREGETFQPLDYEVAPLSMKEAKAFVLRHHYSNSYPSCRFRYGLYLRYGNFPQLAERRRTWKPSETSLDQLVGVAVFSTPMARQVLTNVFPGDFRESVELGRFVLLDCVPSNAESWFKARCRELLRLERIIGIVSFSDDQPRTTSEGKTVFAGHIGTIYQASNAIYLGRGRSRILRLLPDGSVFSERAWSKLRNGERGWTYASDILVKHGADAPTGAKTVGDLREWVDFWLPQLTRPLKHRGNHKYAWALDPKVILPPSLPYPRFA